MLSERVQQIKVARSLCLGGTKIDFGFNKPVLPLEPLCPFQLLAGPQSLFEFTKNVVGSEAAILCYCRGLRNSAIAIKIDDVASKFRNVIYRQLTYPHVDLPISGHPVRHCCQRAA